MDDFKKSGSSSETQSSEKQLLSFGFTDSANSALSVDVVGTIDQSAHTVAVIVPYGTTVTALVATFTCSDKASVPVGSTAQTSGTTENNFTNAVTYTVTAEDGSAQAYTVTVYGVKSDAICETVQDAPAVSTDSYGTDGTYKSFGSWPQKIKADGVTIYEGVTKTMGANTYYLGSDGYWYAKVTAEPYDDDYTFANGTAVARGTEYYFKVEPIKWRVLESGKLLAESILANVCYYGSTSNRTLGSTTIYANNYNYSNIRAWLNGTDNQFVTDHGTRTSSDIDWSDKGFLQTAFTETAQSYIKTTTVDNSGASTTDATGTLIKADGTNIAFSTNYTCVNTNDKIYLLSELEVTNNATYHFAKYNQNDPEYRTLRRRTVSDYARATGAVMNTTETNYLYLGIWWLRSPSCTNNHSYVWDVSYYGNSSRTIGRYDVNDTRGGVVPALSITQ